MFNVFLLKFMDIVDRITLGGFAGLKNGKKIAADRKFSSS